MSGETPPAPEAEASQESPRKTPGRSGKGKSGDPTMPQKSDTAGSTYQPQAHVAAGGPCPAHAGPAGGYGSYAAINFIKDNNLLGYTKDSKRALECKVRVVGGWGEPGGTHQLCCHMGARWQHVGQPSSRGGCLTRTGCSSHAPEHTPSSCCYPHSCCTASVRDPTSAVQARWRPAAAYLTPHPSDCPSRPPLLRFLLCPLGPPPCCPTVQQRPPPVR